MLDISVGIRRWPREIGLWLYFRGDIRSVTWFLIKQHVDLRDK